MAALGFLAFLSSIVFLIILLIRVIRKQGKLRLFAALAGGCFVLFIVAVASLGAASKTIIPKDQTSLTFNQAGDSGVIQPTGTTNTPTPSLKPKLPTPIEKPIPITTPTKEKMRSLTESEKAWALSIQPAGWPPNIMRTVRAYNTWYEEELYARPSLKPPVESGNIRYSLIDIRQTSIGGRRVVNEGGTLETTTDLSGRQTVERVEYIKKDIEVLLKWEVINPERGKVYKDFYLSQIKFSEPQQWDNKEVGANVAIVGVTDSTYRTLDKRITAVLPHNVSWWPKGGLEVELGTKMGIDMAPDIFRGTPYDSPNEALLRLSFTVHIDTDITQKGTRLEMGNLKIDLDGLSDYLFRRD